MAYAKTACYNFLEKYRRERENLANKVTSEIYPFAKHWPSKMDFVKDLSSPMSSGFKDTEALQLALHLQCQLVHLSLCLLLLPPLLFSYSIFLAMYCVSNISIYP